MVTNSVVIRGDSVSKTSPPKINSNICVSVPGCFNKQHMNLNISSDILSKHILLIGGTGCGKTNVFNYFIKQIKQKMTKDDVMIVFDTKGDFINRFYKEGDVFIGNSKAYLRNATKWNIYKEIVVDGWSDEDIHNNVHEILRSFFKEATEKTNQQFFPNAARDLLASILIAQIRMGKNDLEFKQKYFNNKALKHYLDILTPEKIIDLLSAEPFDDLSSVLTYIGDGKSNQALGVLSELQNVIRQILIGVFADDGRFSVREFVRQKGAKTLFVEYDLSIGDTLAPIYRLLFDLALKEAMGRNKSEGKVYIICDEFKLLPNLQHIEDGVNFGRSLGVNILAGIQSIEQLYEIYGENKGHNIAAGFSSVFAFKANDATTRDFVSDLYGKNIVLEQYKSFNNIIVEEKREGKTIEDWDMNSLNVGEAFIGLPFEKPFRYSFDLYRG
jgi:type IV secretory pathway TraG/TraD family ATPase VirD4